MRYKLIYMKTGYPLFQFFYSLELAMIAKAKREKEGYSCSIWAVDKNGSRLASVCE